MKKFITIFFLLLSSYRLFSQTQCATNAGFEQGYFNNWSGAIGTCNHVNCQTYSPTGWGIYRNRHTITSGTSFDQATCYNVPIVCPWGGTYSMRLGNASVGYETESAWFDYTVSATNPILVYAFAMVMQDPAHPDSLQPAFQSFVSPGPTYYGNLPRNPFPCTYYRATATNLRGLSFCQPPAWLAAGIYDSILYVNWQNVAVDLSAYAGQTVTVYFQTNDCGLGAHCGYAYLDIIGCWPKQINIDPCASGTSTQLTAPPGFANYLWSTGETTQSITVNPNLVNHVTCTITSVTGCPIVLTTNSIPPNPTIDFIGTDVCVCDNISTRFTDLSISPNYPISNWLWKFGDGTTSTQQNPNHQYLFAGTYSVSLTVTTINGCRYVLTKQVRVYPCATISMISHN